jgi:hypothetical protein
MSADESATPYKLVFNSRVRDGIKRLQRIAVLVGQRDYLNETLAEIESALQNQSTTWGDPLRIRHGLRMVEYRGFVRRLVVGYAVHLDHPLVWLTSIEPVRGSPLWIGEG